MPRLFRKTLCPALLAGLAAAGAAAAQDAPTPAQRQALDAARAELDRAAARYAELAGHAPMHVDRHLLRKPLLGVVLAPDDDDGVRIAGVTPDGGAGRAGLRGGDRLASIDGRAIAGDDADTRLRDARAQLARLKEGTPVRIGYVRDGRDAVATVTPRVDQRVFLLDAHDGTLARLGGSAMVHRRANGEPVVPADGVQIDPDAIAAQVRRSLAAADTAMPRVERELRRLQDCDADGTCSLPMLSEAFRWTGLNLAAVDAQLGRYFGTDRGVLVLSSGEDLRGLQAGDVLQRIDGKPVASPREAMAALRAKPAGSQVRVDYLRDRKRASAEVAVPKAGPLRIAFPPAPPAAPAPPRAPGAPSPPPAPPGASALPSPPAPAAAPVTARASTTRIAERRMVFVDDDGRTTVLEGDAAPALPAPPEPSAAPVPAPGAD